MQQRPGRTQCLVRAGGVTNIFSPAEDDRWPHGVLLTLLTLLVVTGNSVADLK